MKLTFKSAALAGLTMLVAVMAGCGDSSENNAAPTAAAFIVTAIGNAAKSTDWKTSSSAQDIEGDLLIATVKTQPTKAVFSINGDTLNITPTSNQQGSDTGVLTISDGKGGTVDVTVTIQGVDTLAPTKTAESFPNLDTAGNSGSGSVTFDESVQNVISATFKLASDNSSFAGVTSTTGTGTNTITINYTVPNVAGVALYIELQVTDATGNQRTVRTSDYVVF